MDALTLLSARAALLQKQADESLPDAPNSQGWGPSWAPGWSPIGNTAMLGGAGIAAAGHGIASDAFPAASRQGFANIGNFFAPGRFNARENPLHGAVNTIAGRRLDPLTMRGLGGRMRAGGLGIAGAGMGMSLLGQAISSSRASSGHRTMSDIIGRQRGEIGGLNSRVGGLGRELEEARSSGTSALDQLRQQHETQLNELRQQLAAARRPVPAAAAATPPPPRPATPPPALPAARSSAPAAAPSSLRAFNRESIGTSARNGLSNWWQRMQQMYGARG